MMEAAAAANTTDEEGELVTYDNLLEPLQQLSTSRDEVAELVKKADVEDGNGTNSPVNDDIEHNIREICAILKMNAEIFDRCMEFMVRGRSEGDQWFTLFNRTAYEVVETNTCIGEFGTRVMTWPSRTLKDFCTTPLSKLPQGLDDIIVSRNMIGKSRTGSKLSQFIDFEAFFKKSLALHETVLEQFLPKLKDHLMSIQVCLGEIDAWVIQEPQGNISFLEDTFGEDEDAFVNGNIQLRGPCGCEEHMRKAICVNCGKQFCDHHSSERRCNVESSSVAAHRVQLFHCGCGQMLKRYSNNGKFERTFKLTDEMERARLKKLLELMAMF